MKEPLKIISPIAIDMGAKNTGVYLNHFEQGIDPTNSNNAQGTTTIIDSGKITWSQIARRQKRHQIRTGKRRKLSKRLLKLILTDKEAYKLNNITQEQLEFLMSLLNHRGYNRIEVTPEQEKILKLKIVSDFFFPIIFNRNNNNSDLLEELSRKVIIDSEDGKKQWEKILKNEVFSLSGKNHSKFKEYAKKQIEKEEIKELSKAVTAIKKLIQIQIDNYKTGHLHRKNYLENIKEDIKKSELLKPLLGQELTAKKLAYLIGNISNLQLKILRKYFNDDNMYSVDKWHPEKLHDLFFKWVRSWHTKQEIEKQNRKQLLALKNKDILKVFTTSDPEHTIPPYEDQNNRIKESIKDKTLRLDPDKLDKNFSEWQQVTKKIIANYCEPTNDSRITTSVDIQEKIDNSTHLNIKKEDKDKRKDYFEKQKLANTLQRVFDRNKNLDPYKLRLLCSIDNLSLDTLKDDALTAYELLDLHIGNSNIKPFISLLKAYYEEVNKARQGLWSSDNSSLFFVCNTNPPHKSNLQHKLVGHIVRENLTPERLKEFQEECWHQKIGKKAMASMAESIEETRKEYGNAFNYISTIMSRRQHVLTHKGDKVTSEQKAKWERYEQEYKDIKEARKNAVKIAEKIAKYFNHNDNKREKYTSPYSIAQLYNHLETDIGGFNKTDKYNTEENAWRDDEKKIEVVNKKTGEVNLINVSNASRLTRDSIRPFDGMLARILTRQAYEISQTKIEQLEQLNIARDEDIFLPIFLEQNKFKFEQSLIDIKGKKNVKKETKDRVEKGLKKQEERWQSKDKRIKGDKEDKELLCPYTDQKIGCGELDHIIPQSESKKKGNVVFNSEANLIYCSSKGNQEKGNQSYTLDNLKPKYLESIFKTSDKSSIQKEIRNFIKELDIDNFTGFHNLDTEEQAYLRHALFMPELHDKTFQLLNTRYKNLVNGTQAYLAKLLVKNLKAVYPEANFKIYQINAYNVSNFRKILGNHYQELAKSDETNTSQSAFSHVIDAAMVFATALQVAKIAEELHFDTNISGLPENPEWLKRLLPNNIDMRHIERKPTYRKKLSSVQIFKEGLYGERFVPLLLDGKKLHRGFSLDNCIEIKIKPEETYNLLKPFLYTGKKKDKKPVAENLSDYQQQAQQSKKTFIYLTIDKTKALTHLQKCAKEICSNIEIEQAKALEKLRYGVEKKKIKDILLTGKNKKTFIKKGDLDKKLTIDKSNVSNLTLPAKADWERIMKHPILKKCFGKEEKVPNQDLINFWKDLSTSSGFSIENLKHNLLKKNNKKEVIITQEEFKKKIKQDDTFKKLQDNDLLKKAFGAEFKVKVDLIPQESWDKLFEEFFHTNKIKNPKKHRRVRKDYSLPVVSGPSGGFRIKRKNPITDELVYQVSSIKSFSTKGYDSELKQVVLIDNLRTSRNISTIKEQFQAPPNEDDICYFDQWREISPLPADLKEKITSLYYAINSKDRFRIRVEMPFKYFQQLDDSIQSWEQVKSEIEVKKEIFKTYFLIDNPKSLEKQITLLGQPRDKLFVENIRSERITFTYIVDRTNKEMKAAYQKGRPIEQ